MTAAHAATAAVLALAVGTAAWMATKTKISAPLRVAIARRRGRLAAWISDLMACPFCLAHWLAFAAVAIYRPWLVGGFILGQFIVTSLAIVAGAMLVVLVAKKALT